MANWSDCKYGDTLDTQQFGRQPNQSPHSTMWTYISSVSIYNLMSSQTLLQDDRKIVIRTQTDVYQLRSSSLFTSLHRTNKHNNTVNLHAQNCCTQNSKNQTHPKISQNVYKSKRNLVAKWCVRITHRIHYDYCWSTHGGDNNPTHKHYMSEILCPWRLSNYITLILTINNGIQLTSFWFQYNQSRWFYSTVIYS